MLASEPTPAISSADCRDLLGNEASGRTDDEIEVMRLHAEAMALVLIEIWLNRDKS